MEEYTVRQAKLSPTQYLATKSSSPALLSSGTWESSGTLENTTLGH